MHKTTFSITKMDCPSEENLIRMKLVNISGIKQLDFDIPNRKLVVFHQNNLEEITQSIAKLKLNSKIVNTENVSSYEEVGDDRQQTRILWYVLLINFSFFVLEIIYGLISKSMGLVSDSLDMLADSVVYALSLLAVGGSLLLKKRIATTAGYFQMALATLGFIEVIRRFLNPEVIPDFTTMIVVSILALIANAICLVLLQKATDKEQVHMKASMIFTSNDIIINLGIITAGICVNWLDSNKPDLIIGSIVFILVFKGALRILQLGK